MGDILTNPAPPRNFFCYDQDSWEDVNNNINTTPIISSRIHQIDPPCTDLGQQETGRVGRKHKLQPSEEPSAKRRKEDMDFKKPTNSMMSFICCLKASTTSDDTI